MLGGAAMISLSQQIVDLAQRLAVARHRSVEETVRLAIEEKARAEGIVPAPRRPRDPSPEAVAERRARTDGFVAALASMPVLDRRATREIMDDLDAL